MINTFNLELNLLTFPSEREKGIDWGMGSDGGRRRRGGHSSKMDAFEVTWVALWLWMPLSPLCLLSFLAPWTSVLQQIKRIARPMMAGSLRKGVTPKGSLSEPLAVAHKHTHTHTDSLWTT